MLMMVPLNSPPSRSGYRNPGCQSLAQPDLKQQRNHVCVVSARDWFIATAVVSMQRIGVCDQPETVSFQVDGNSLRRGPMDFLVVRVSKVQIHIRQLSRCQLIKEKPLLIAGDDHERGGLGVKQR